MVLRGSREDAKRDHETIARLQAEVAALHRVQTPEPPLRARRLSVEDVTPRSALRSGGEGGFRGFHGRPDAATLLTRGPRTGSPPVGPGRTPPLPPYSHTGTPSARTSQHRGSPAPDSELARRARAAAHFSDGHARAAANFADGDLGPRQAYLQAIAQNAGPPAGLQGLQGLHGMQGMQSPAQSLGVDRIGRGAVDTGAQSAETVLQLLHATAARGQNPNLALFLGQPMGNPGGGYAAQDGNLFSAIPLPGLGFGGLPQQPLPQNNQAAIIAAIANAARHGCYQGRAGDGGTARPVGLSATALGVQQGVGLRGGDHDGSSGLVRQENLGGGPSVGFGTVGDGGPQGTGAGTVQAPGQRYAADGNMAQTWPGSTRAAPSENVGRAGRMFADGGYQGFSADGVNISGEGRSSSLKRSRDTARGDD
jgi:hypothetical protein